MFVNKHKVNSSYVSGSLVYIVSFLLLNPYDTFVRESTIIALLQVKTREFKELIRPNCHIPKNGRFRFSKRGMVRHLRCPLSPTCYLTVSPNSLFLLNTIYRSGLFVLRRLPSTHFIHLVL